MKKLLKIFAVTALIIFAVILTAFSEKASALCIDALRVCALSVVPALFPYMIISRMLVSSGAFAVPKRLFWPVRILGLPPSCGAAVLMGALCGFPVGAATAVEMYKKGELSKTQTEVLISACNNTGPSFVISVIGVSFFKSAAFGRWLYFSQLAASLVSAVIVNRLLFPFKRENEPKASVKIVVPDVFSAVQGSVLSTLTVCGFIVFFYVISGFTVPLIKSFSPLLSGVFAAILEFSGGAGAAALEGGVRGRFLCGLAVGFSGLSVFCQTASFTQKEEISLKRCFCTKIIQGIITGSLCTAPLPFAKEIAAFSVTENADIIGFSPVIAAIISCFLCIFAAKAFIDE
ncbi:MAG: hypothetical protein IKL24_06855 [Clostridia bacterium]|nr:hypothetical protein [Clostridia bacterium]